MKLTKRRKQILKQKAIGLAILIFSILSSLVMGEIGTVGMVFAMVGLCLICMRSTIKEIIMKNTLEEVEQEIENGNL